MTTLGCTVTVAGQPLAAGAADLQAGTLTALAGLKITWGRSTRLDQPAPSTMTMSAAVDADRIDQALALLAPGTPITVEAPAPEGSPVTTQTILSSTVVRNVTYNETTPIHYPPAALDAEGTNPTAWDSLPRVTRGSSYTLTANISKMPAQSTARLYIVYYAGPWASTRVLGEELASRTSVGTLTATITPTDAHIGEHVGLAVAFNPLGRTWAGTPTTWAKVGESWQDMGAAAIAAASITRVGSSSALATPFMGRITDAVLQWDQTLKKARIDITAKDSSAEHANMRISSEPWPAETAGARIGRALDATGQNIRTILDPAPAGLTLSSVDVDRQAPTSVLQDVATSTGAIIWPAAHRTLGEYYRLEDLNKRISLYRLQVTDAGTAYLEVAAKGATKIPASTLARDVTVERDTTDLATVVSVAWSEETTDATGKPVTTQRHETVEDADRISTYGYRSLSVSTTLNKQQAARQLASETLARSAAGGWTIPRAQWSPHRQKAPDLDAVRQALDATSRMGLPIILTSVAPWVPGAPTIPVYLDGGAYTYDGHNWTLDLQLTRAATPGDSLTWKQTPTALTWAQMDALTWTDLASATN